MLNLVCLILTLQKKFKPLLSGITVFFKKFFFLFFCFFVFFFVFNFFNFKKSFFLFFLLGLFLINLFSYFITIYTSSKYTSPIKFFWVRVFHIFWALEFYLLVIFLFLFIISPDELFYLFEKNNWFFKNKINATTNYNYFLIFLMLFLINFLVTAQSVDNFFLKAALIFLLVILFNKILFSEFFIFLNNLNTVCSLKRNITQNKHSSTFLWHLNNNNKLLTWKFSTRYTTVENLPIYHRPRINILNMIFLIKFLHIILIVFFNYIIVILFSKNNLKGYELFGFLQQNLIIVLIFWLTNYIIFLKFLFKNVNYGFYENISLLLFKNKIIFFQELYIF